MSIVTSSSRITSIISVIGIISIISIINAIITIILSLSSALVKLHQAACHVRCCDIFSLDAESFNILSHDMNPGRDHTSVHLQGKQRQIALLTAS